VAAGISVPPAGWRLPTSILVAALSSRSQPSTINTKTKIMKFNKWILGLAAVAALAFTSAVRAQTPVVTLPPIPTNAPVQTIPNFFQQVATWSTSVDTNKNWNLARFEIEDGLKQITGAASADYLRVTLDFTNSGFYVVAEAQFYGIGSPFNAGEFGGGYNFIVNHDFKLGADLIGGYDNTKASWVVESEIKASKMMTANTFVTAAFSLPISGKGKFSSAGQFRVGAGILF
jgi:hypothetical protein